MIAKIVALESTDVSIIFNNIENIYCFIKMSAFQKNKSWPTMSQHNDRISIVSDVEKNCKFDHLFKHQFGDVFDSFFCSGITFQVL